MMSETTVKHHPTWGVWAVGDALFWRNAAGVHCVIQTKETERSPRGALRNRGVMTDITAPTLLALNAALHELGFCSTRLRLRDIKVAP